MDQYKHEREKRAAAIEMYIQLHPDADTPGFDFPTSIDDDLLTEYKGHMRKSGSYAGEIEIKLILDIIKRPILIFKLDPNDKGRIRFPSSGYAGEEQNFKPELNGFTQFNNQRPIILGHIAKLQGDDPNHYIYALFDDEIPGVMGSKRKNKKTKRKKASGKKASGKKASGKKTKRKKTRRKKASGKKTKRRY